MRWPYFTFFFVEEGVREEAAQAPKGGRRRWGAGGGVKWKGTYCTVAELNSGISPSPRASQQNAPLDKWAKSQTNLKRDSFHSAPAEEGEEREGVECGVEERSREKCQLFHPLSDSDCHWRKTDECFSDLWCFSLRIKCRLCYTGRHFENLIAQRGWARNKKIIIKRSKEIAICKAQKHPPPHTHTHYCSIITIKSNIFIFSPPKPVSADFWFSVSASLSFLNKGGDGWKLILSGSGDEKKKKKGCHCESEYQSSISRNRTNKSDGIAGIHFLKRGSADGRWGEKKGGWGWQGLSKKKKKKMPFSVSQRDISPYEPIVKCIHIIH